MAGNIRGIDVEIGGNTVGLKKALQEVNKETGKTARELSEVNRLLQLDPKNTELAAQKQKLLGEQVETTKNKLTALRKAKENADDAIQKGEQVNQEQYRKLQREIVAAETQLKSLEKQAKETGKKFQAAAENLNKFGKNAIEIGKKGMVVTAAVAGIGAAAVASFNTVDDGMDTIIKKTGATGEAAQMLERVYKNVAGNMPVEFEQVGDAVGELNTRFGFVGDTLRVASEDFLKFARINDMDVLSAVQLVSRAMGDAGIESAQYAGVLDVLTKAAQVTGISIETLTESVTKYGAPMRALGFDTAESIALFGSWEKAGVNTEIAFSGMKKAISNWAKSGKDSRVEFKKTLDEIKSCPDIASATTKAIETFGAKAGPDLADAIQGGRFAFEGLLQELQSADGITNTTFDGVIDGVDKAKIATNNAQMAFSELGKVIMDAVAPILDNITAALQGVTEWFANLTDGQKQTVVIIAAVVAALPPLIMLIGALSTGLGVLTGIVGVLGAPVTLIIAAIAAITAAVMYLWNTNEGFRNAVIAAWTAIAAAAQAVWGAIVKFFTVDIPAAWNSVISFFAAIPQWFAELWNNIILAFQGGWLAIVNFFTVSIPQWILSIVTFFNELPYKIGVILGELIGRFIQFGLNLISWVTTELPQIILNILMFFQELPGKIWGFLCTAVANLAQWGLDMASQGLQAASATVSNVVAFFNELPGNIWNALVNALTNLIAWGVDMLSKGNEAALNVVNGIMTTMWELPNKTIEVGTNVVKGLWNGISNSIEWVKNKIKEFSSGVLDGIKNALGIQSPSKYTKEFGRYLVEGLAEGITEDMSAEEAAEKKAQNVLNAFNEGLSGIDAISKNAELKYNLWLKTFGAFASEEEKAAKKAELYNSQLEAQEEAGKVAWANLNHARQEFGADSSEAVEAENKYLEILNETEDIRQEMKEALRPVVQEQPQEVMSQSEQDYATQQYFEWMRVNEKGLRSAGLDDETIKTAGAKATGYDKVINIEQHITTKQGSPSEIRRETEKGVRRLEMEGIL